jgi:hypothetical protein
VPKQIYQIKDFSGGLNNLQVPTDIRDNQLSNVQNLMFNTQGAIYPVYKMSSTGQAAPNGNDNRLTVGTYSNTHIVSTTSGESVQAGYGLGYFEIDWVRDPVTVSVTGDDSASTGFKGGSNLTQYTTGSVQDLASSFPVGSQFLLTGSSGQNSFGSNKLDHSAQGIYTVVAHNGNALVPDRNITINVETGTDYWGATVKGFVYGDQIILIANPKEHKIDTFSFNTAGTKWEADSITLRSSESGIMSKVRYYKGDNAIRCCDTAEKNDCKIQWYGHIARRHFSDMSASTSSSATGNEYFDYYSKDNDLSPPSEDDLTSASTATPSNFTTYPASNGTGFELNIISHTDVDGAIPAGVYECASTFIYDGNQESLPFPYSNTHTIADANDLKSLSLNVSAKGPYNPRISGGRIYIREVGSDSEWVLLIDIDLTKGCRTRLSDEYTKWHNAGSSQYNCPTATASDNFEVREFNLINYEIINGFPSSVFSHAIGDQGEHWKDSVVANNRVFVCNVTIKDEAKGSSKATSTITRFPDRIMYSMPNRYDTFPYYNFIEAAKGDVDHYVAIDAYADRLLAFKRFSLDIININGDDRNWFLENSLKYQGVTHPEAVQKTQYGIIWANKQGFFLYDGSQIRNLSENLISDSIWSAHISEDSMVIYDEQESMAFIIKSAGSDGDAYMCDMKKGTWTFVNDFVQDSNDGITNSVDTETNNTFIAHDEGDTIDFYQMYRAGVSSSNSRFQTKQTDFGNASVSKKVYAVYVTYKSDAALTGYFTLEEDDGTPHDLNGDVGTSASEWATVKLTPNSPVVCNKVAVKMNTSGNVRKVHINDIGIDVRVLKKRAA